MNIIDMLRGEMIVSCQAEGKDPFNVPEYVALFAQAAQMGGAKGIRTEGIEKIKAIKKVVGLPVIKLLVVKKGHIEEARYLCVKKNKDV